MAAVSRSPRLFRERKGLIPTYRAPMPVVAMASLGIRGYRLKDPRPADQQRPLEGDPPPDRGVSREWPFLTEATDA